MRLATAVCPERGGEREVESHGAKGRDGDASRFLSATATVGKKTYVAEISVLVKGIHQSIKISVPKAGTADCYDTCVMYDFTEQGLSWGSACIRRAVREPASSDLGSSFSVSGVLCACPEYCCVGTRRTAASVNIYHHAGRKDHAVPWEEG